MKSVLAVVASGLVLACLLGNAPNESKGLFGPLEKGQKVSLKETANGFEVGVIPGAAELGYKIAEIGENYIVLEDIAGVAETRIPIYSVKSIKITRMPKK